jgi:hypothetical protein
MRRIRIMGLCLVAAFAMSVVAAASASAALPEYVKGGKTNTAKVSFTNKSMITAKLEGAVVIECTSDTGKGKIEGAKHTSGLVVTYKGCTAPSITSSCQTSPKVPGVIKTASLKGELVYAKETKTGANIVANELTPTTGTSFAKFSCGPLKELKVEVKGLIYAEPSPINSAESVTGFSTNEAQAVEPELGCGLQKLQYKEGSVACEHLFTPAGKSWNIAKDQETFKAAVGIKG